ncbi:MAG: class I SAM-dependent methyltransferase [Spirochaetales bacterium]|nr:class I SAM-dependent methyltransferase [Leptospiraceae bacterium]MCP5481258.1 class I SAM-dependent methyltransferase [Spirochaetales bacterium]MCP5485694.1 class I SAM-dependent methyltransferase [Spirochaetales bacterium]
MTQHSRNARGRFGDEESEELYATANVRALFDEMSATYRLVNLVTSFGFSQLWRSQAVRLLRPRRGSHVADLMTGMGESFAALARHLGPEGHVTAIDFSAAMLRHAESVRKKARGPAIDLVEADVFDYEPDQRFDFILCNFGIKTLAQYRAKQLAELVENWLSPAGSFVFLEISVPANRILREPYMFYLKRIIPWLGRLFLGNPDNYRMLGLYTERFKDCGGLAATFRKQGFQIEERRLFFGCATAIRGCRSQSIRSSTGQGGSEPVPANGGPDQTPGPDTPAGPERSR